MQRVGRINRVDTKFDKVYTFNFFPTKQANDQIKLREAAEAKINAFLSWLGGDANLLTENEPIGSHELFSRLTSKEVLTGEDEGEESELKYLHVIKNIRDKEPDTLEVRRLNSSCEPIGSFSVSKCASPPSRDKNALIFASAASRSLIWSLACLVGKKLKV